MELPYCVPAKPPKYMVGFFEFAQKKQRKGEDYGFVSELVKKHWDAFHKAGKERKTRVKKDKAESSDTPMVAADPSSSHTAPVIGVPIIQKAVDIAKSAEAEIEEESDSAKVKEIAVDALKAVQATLAIMPFVDAKMDE